MAALSVLAGVEDWGGSATFEAVGVSSTLGVGSAEAPVVGALELASPGDVTVLVGVSTTEVGTSGVLEGAAVWPPGEELLCAEGAMTPGEVAVDAVLLASGSAASAGDCSDWPQPVATESSGSNKWATNAVRCEVSFIGMGFGGERERAPNLLD